MFSSGQRTAVAGAFRLAGYEGPILVAPIVSEDERAFLLDPAALQSIHDRRTLEQVLQQLLGRKVFVVERRDSAWGAPISFE